MTKRKYIRLLLVCALPLFVAGIFTTESLFNGQPYAAVTCEQYTDKDNCRYLGDWESSLYKHVKSETPLWFDMGWERRNYMRSLVFAEATSRTLNDIRVSAASPYLGSGQHAADVMNSLVGSQNTSIQLGFESGQRSYLGDGVNILLCHSLVFKESSNDYEAACFGEGWGGIITFGAFGDSKRTLVDLETQVSDEVNRFFVSRIVEKAILWPMFIYLFLLLSLAVYLIRKAARYVNAG